MLLSTAFAREAPLGAAFVRLVSVIDREIQPLRSCHRNRRCPVTLLALLAAMIAAPDLASAQEIVAPPRASLQTSQTNPSPAQTNPSPAQTADQTPDQRAAQTERLQSDIGYLASDELRGRGVGDVSIDQAAQYISQRMSEIGLETDAWEGSPRSIRKGRSCMCVRNMPDFASRRHATPSFAIRRAVRGPTPLRRYWRKGCEGARSIRMESTIHGCSEPGLRIEL